MVTLPGKLEEHRVDIANTIMTKCGELDVGYENPHMFTQVMFNWFNINYINWGKMWDALMEEYNPIENYDRTEDSTSDNTFTAGTQNVTENEISAMNTSGYSNDTKNTSVNSGTDESDNVYHSRVHGNIGVTTTQQMIQQELELRKWNLFEYIADKFEEDLMIRVY